jgi:hypothetical protein
MHVHTKKRNWFQLFFFFSLSANHEGVVTFLLLLTPEDCHPDLVRMQNLHPECRIRYRASVDQEKHYQEEHCQPLHGIAWLSHPLYYPCRKTGTECEAAMISVLSV